MITQADIDEAANYIKNKIVQAGMAVPKTALVCDIGLHNLDSEVENAIRIPYQEIPHFPPKEVTELDKNQVVIGKLSRTPVILLQGAFHVYEGLTEIQCTMYVRVLNELDVNALAIYAAVAGLNPHFNKGSIAIVTDHLNMGGLFGAPLLSPSDDPNADTFEFKRKKSYYNRKINMKCEKISIEAGFESTLLGHYMYAVGPCYPTVAEASLVEEVDADVYGTFGVPDVIMATECQMKVFLFGFVSHECSQEYEHDMPQVMSEATELCARQAEPLQNLAKKLVDFLASSCMCPKHNDRPNPNPNQTPNQTTNQTLNQSPNQTLNQTPNQTTNQ